MKPTATYARVSTARQEDEQTIRTQMSAVKDLIEKKGGLNVVQEYADDGWSGDILARPALDQLRQDAKAKRWQVLVVYDPDRIARRYSYQELVMDELLEAGVELLFVTITAPKSSEDKILHGVRGLFAEYERAKIVERFRLGKVRKVREGHILVSEPLYGYNYVAKKDKVHGYYEVNEVEAAVVRRIFDWVDRDGVTLRKLVRKLQQSGLAPRKSKRGVWATSTLSHLLRNKAYIGEARWGSSYAVVPEKPKRIEQYRKIRKTSRRMKPESEWMKIPVPAIIDTAVFHRVQERLRKNFLLCKRNTKNEYLLAGKIYCSCGRKRGGEGPQNGKYLYYRCLDRTLNFPLARTCYEKSVEARSTDRVVWDGITNLMSSPELMKAQIKLWIEKQGSEGDVATLDVELLKNEIARLKEQEKRYNQAYGSGLFSIDQLKEYIAPLKTSIAMHEAELGKCNSDRQAFCKNTLIDMEKVEEIAVEASRNLPSLSFAAKRGIILKVIEKVVATRDGLQVYGFIPINNVDFFTNDRNGLDTITYKCRSNASNAVGDLNLLHDGHASVPFEFSINLPALER